MKVEELRAFFAVGSERRYIPRMVEIIVRERPGEVAAICLIRSPSKPGRKQGLLNTIRERRPYWRTGGFFTAAVEYFALRWADRFARRLSLKWLTSPRAAALRHEIPYFETTSVNSDEFREMMRSVGANLLVSISVPLLFKKETLETPKLGAINIHNGLLPDYRGMMPVFWALANGETEVGATVHYMNEKFDEGALISQERVPVSPKDTIHTLETKLRWDVGPRLLIRAMDDIQAGTVTPLPNPVGEGRYFGKPTPEAIEQFRRRGRGVR